MRINELIKVLENARNLIGNQEVYFLNGSRLYEFTFLGPSQDIDGDFFWLTTNSNVALEDGEDPSQFRAPRYEPELKLVKGTK